MAAPIVSLDHVALLQGERPLFDDLSLFIGERDRLALIGRNGAGKTTLFRLLAGLIEADRGRRAARPGARIALLPQDPPVEGFATLADFALAGADAPPAHAVAAIAQQIGIDLRRPAATASGGERRRAAIARALAAEPDLLLLDEPTNHLDIEAIRWLEDWVARSRAAFVAISHDRAFLARLTSACLWLDRGRLRRRDIGFGGFEAWTEEVLAEETRAAERMDAKLAQELHWLQRGVTARRRRNQGRLTRLQAMRADRQVMLGQQGTARLALATDELRSKLVIEADGVFLAFADQPIVRDFSIRIQRGDRIGIVGPNGAGKTTLIRLLTGELAPDRGRVAIAPGLNGIRIDQQRQLLDPARRVRDVLADGGEWIDVRGSRTHLRGYLKQFLFDPGLADARIASLSGGERSRLLLAREFARQSSLLVLDEPTNDLDLETLDLLQEVIADFEGTVLLVSHDRDFLDRTTSMTIGLDGSGRHWVVAGGWRELERAIAGSAGQRPARAGAPAAAAAAAAAPPRTKRADRLGFRDRHDLERLPAAIEALTRRIAETEQALSDPDLYRADPQRMADLTGQLEALRAELAAAEERWLDVAARAEALEAG